MLTIDKEGGIIKARPQCMQKGGLKPATPGVAL